VKDLLLGREAVLEELARGGVTDPAEIVACVQVLRAELPAGGGASGHLQRVLAATDAADERLAGAAGFVHARRAALRSSQASMSADAGGEEPKHSA
jgi:hypothetical protein